MKYAMNIDDARRLGTQFAAGGWDEQRIGDWLLDAGYKADGVTAQRIRSAYSLQRSIDRMLERTREFDQDGPDAA